MFISFEGLDGCGKTTQAALLADALRTEGREVVAVREPGGTAAGERIRELLLDPSAQILPWAEALLYAAARAQLVGEVIRPALARGATVIADRFIDSSVAYQGVARGLGIDRVLAVNDAATGGLQPDRTVLLRIPREEAAARRDGDTDRMESEAGAFHESVAEGFSQAAARFPERVRVVDAGGSREQVAARVREAAGV
ncbi:MAG TPA: dTMP kinase [Gaiellales bacterium]|jgi:dTMP kinase|nr:dTMP kinase [Gaiellales bacterium]